jgi:hypothetical protein
VFRRRPNKQQAAVVVRISKKCLEMIIMKLQLLTLASMSILSASVLADAARDDWERGMEQRLQRLEGQRQSQQEEQPAWYDAIELEGLVEVEANRVSPEHGDTTSDINAATVELGLEAEVNAWVAVELLLLYEEDTDNNGDFNVDTALITLANPDTNWFVRAGRSTLPFGLYPTQMISDPLTLDLGEINDSAIEAGYAVGEFEFSLFLFQGDRNDTADNFGAQLDYDGEIAGVSSHFNLGYLDNLAESDTIVDEGWVTVDDKMAAWTASAEFGIGPWTLIGDYLDVHDGFADASDESPSVYNLELGYDLELAGLPVNVAIGYQASDGAEDGNWGLPEKRLIGGFSIELLEETVLGFEFKRDEDYAGERENKLTAQLAVSF